jgi:hypothetical protein
MTDTVAQLLVLAVIGLVIYGLVRLVAAMIAGLAGARHRAYRQLAARYGGRYENRGMVDPPTVSFAYNGSSVRVGLAPVVQGQPASPRTRVVARFARGMPLRVELIPAGRATPPQPPKGTRLVDSGHPEFDRSFVVRANDPDMAQEFLRAAPVRTSIESLLRMAPPAGMLISINPERLLVQVDRNLGTHASLLEFAVRDALIIHDGLLYSVSLRVSEGISITSAGPASSMETGTPPECEVCGDPIAGAHVVCSACRTPFHRDCWNFIGGCSTFGCTSRHCSPA